MVDAVSLEEKIAKARELAEKGAMPETIELMVKDIAEKYPEHAKAINEILKLAYQNAIQPSIDLAKENAKIGDVLAVKVITTRAIDYIGLAGAKINGYEAELIQIQIDCYENAIKDNTEWIKKYGQSERILTSLKMRNIKEYRIKKDELLEELENLKASSK